MIKSLEISEIKSLAQKIESLSKDVQSQLDSNDKEKAFESTVKLTKHISSLTFALGVKLGETVTPKFYNVRNEKGKFTKK